MFFKKLSFEIQNKSMPKYKSDKLKMYYRPVKRDSQGVMGLRNGTRREFAASCLV